MYMAPDSWRGLYESLLAQAKSGAVPMQRLDDAVARILRVKFRMGMFDAGKPSARPGAGEFSTLGSAAHRDIARRAVRESSMLERTIPISSRKRRLPNSRGSTGG
jgi:beta-glucosidase